MKRKMNLIVGILVLMLFALTFVYLFLNSRSEADVYEVIEPQQGTLERTTVLTGRIEPRDEVEIKPQISGIVSEINVSPGDKVDVGDVIAKIKVIPEESQLSSAQNRVDIARVSLDQAKNEHERTKSLYERKFVSREEFERSETEVSKAEIEFASAVDALSLVRDGISSINAYTSNTLVRATVSGIILEIPIKVGSSVIHANTMNDGTTVAKIADMNHLIFVGKVDETEVGLLYPGIPAKITVGALPDWHTDGSVEYIAPKSTDDNGSNTFELKARIAVDKGIQLRAGYSANATICLDRAEDIIMLPEGVIEWRNDSTFVQLLTASSPEQHWERRNVTTGLSDGVNIEIKSGITLNDRVRGNKISR